MGLSGDLPGPSVTASRRYPAASVIHVRFAVHPSSPWRGVSPLAWATSTGKLGAFLETRLGEESSGPVGYLLSVPSEGGDENLEGLRSDLANLGGGVSIVETTAGGWGEGRGAAPRSDWKPQRLGASIPAGNVELWSKAWGKCRLGGLRRSSKSGGFFSGRNGTAGILETVPPWKSPAGRQNH